LSHFGFPQEVKLAKEVDGIDILLRGHTHNSLVEPVVINDTIIMQSGCHGAHIGRLDVHVKDGHIVCYNHDVIEVAVPEDVGTNHWKDRRRSASLCSIRNNDG